MTESSLIKLDNLDTAKVLAIFIGDGLDKILAEIKNDAENFVADVETPRGRQAMKSKAREIAGKKVKIDAAGKELVAEQKRQLKVVDNARKKSRDFLDEVRDEVRRPLTDWKAAETARIETEEAAAESEAMHAEALEANVFFDKQKDIERREAVLKTEEAARLEAEKKRQEEIEREEREKKIAEDAKHEAEEKAKREKVEAVEAERRRNKAKEQTRLYEERSAKEKAEKKAANTRHRAKINREAIASFVAIGYDESEADNLITVIANGKIKHITINY